MVSLKNSKHPPNSSRINRGRLSRSAERRAASLRSSKFPVRRGSNDKERQHGRRNLGKPTRRPRVYRKRAGCNKKYNECRSALITPAQRAARKKAVFEAAGYFGSRLRPTSKLLPALIVPRITAALDTELDYKHEQPHRHTAQGGKQIETPRKLQGP